MAGRPSGVTLALLTERLEAVEAKLLEVKSVAGDPVAAPQTWSAELEARVKKLEAQIAQMTSFIKNLHSL